MSRSSLYALLFGLALVFQIIAGAAAVAPTSPAPGAGHHCVDSHGGRHVPGPIDSGGDHAHCAQCLTCTWGVDAAILPELSFSLSRKAAPLEAQTRSASPAIASLTHVERARGPPTDLIS